MFDNAMHINNSHNLKTNDSQKAKKYYDKSRLTTPSSFSNFNHQNIDKSSEIYNIEETSKFLFIYIFKSLEQNLN